MNLNSENSKLTIKWRIRRAKVMGSSYYIGFEILNQDKSITFSSGKIWAEKDNIYHTDKSKWGLSSVSYPEIGIYQECIFIMGGSGSCNSIAEEEDIGTFKELAVFFAEISNLFKEFASNGCKFNCKN